MADSRKRAKAALPVDWAIRPVTARDWDLIETLFGHKGACGGCWCMSWRVPKHGKAWEAAKGEPNRLEFKRLLEGDNVNAVIALHGEEPIGWCTFGPRESFPRIKGMRSLQREATSGVWSVVCFFIRPAWRKAGLGTALLKAATGEALRLGAREVEGFPAVPWDPAVAVPAAFAWTGLPRQYAMAGFRLLERKDARRPIYVLRAPGEPG